MKRAYLDPAIDSIKNAAQYAYLAGILDGEGCISLAKRVVKGRRYIIATVQVTNTDRRLLEWLQYHYGGGIYKHSYDNTIGRGRKTTYLWCVAADKAMRVVDDAFPYLIVKREQAELLRSIPRREAYRDSENGRLRVRMTNEDFAENDRLVTAMRRLNRRGVHATEIGQE